jgi:hypothetical protein
MVLRFSGEKVQLRGPLNYCARPNQLRGSTRFSNFPVPQLLFTLVLIFPSQIMFIQRLKQILYQHCQPMRPIGYFHLLLLVPRAESGKRGPCDPCFSSALEFSFLDFHIQTGCCSMLMESCYSSIKRFSIHLPSHQTEV